MASHLTTSEERILTEQRSHEVARKNWANGSRRVRFGKRDFVRQVDDVYLDGAEQWRGTDPGSHTNHSPLSNVCVPMV